MRPLSEGTAPVLRGSPGPSHPPEALRLEAVMLGLPVSSGVHGVQTVPAWAWGWRGATGCAFPCYKVSAQSLGLKVGERLPQAFLSSFRLRCKAGTSTAQLGFTGCGNVASPPREGEAQLCPPSAHWPAGRVGKAHPHGARTRQACRAGRGPRRSARPPIADRSRAPGVGQTGVLPRDLADPTAGDSVLFQARAVKGFLSVFLVENSAAFSWDREGVLSGFVFCSYQWTHGMKGELLPTREFTSLRVFPERASCPSPPLSHTHWLEEASWGRTSPRGRSPPEDPGLRTRSVAGSSHLPPPPPIPGRASWV